MAPFTRNETTDMCCPEKISRNRLRSGGLISLVASTTLFLGCSRPGTQAPPPAAGAEKTTGQSTNEAANANSGHDETIHTATTELASGVSSATQSPQFDGLQIDIVAFGRQLGAIAPCGCTSDPLGGLDYAFGYLDQETTASTRVVVEPGSFLFAEPGGPHAADDGPAWEQAYQRASLLHHRFSALQGAVIRGLGPTDFSSPLAATALKRWSGDRLLTNAAASKGIVASREVRLANAVDVAILEVVDPQLEWPKRSGLRISEPVAALKRTLAQLSPTTDIRVVVAHGKRSFAEAVARSVEGVDIVIAGGPVGDVDTGRFGGSPSLIGKTWVVEPGDQAQSISRIRLAIGETLAQRLQLAEPSDAIASAPSWSVVADAAQRKAAAQRLADRLAKFRKDPQAEPSFLRRLEAEYQAALQPVVIAPAPDGVAIQLEQVKISCRLPSDRPTKDLLREYDATVSAANAKRFADVHAPPVKKGEPHYAGIGTCKDCHEEAEAFWQGTIHARAYETLVVDNKQFDLACVGCHVTGYRQPGGSEVVQNQGLRDVQCESCHGAGSIHAEDGDTERISLHSPADVCLSCHTPEHSDTFNYEAYLRDILGPGHGEAARAQLGEGPTGHELRAAALKKAGGSCKKM